MIVGISASGRRNRVVEQTVRAILEETGQEYELISLAGKTINGCTGCLGCVDTNICVVKDDWPVIADKLKSADAIVFGAPKYFGTLNARGHACLERTFSFRHNCVFPLQGKPAVSVSTSSTWSHNRRPVTPDDPVRDFIQALLKENKLDIVGHVTADGYGPCFTCGYGHNCDAGGAMTEKSQAIGGFEKADYPQDFCDQKETLRQVHEVAGLLKKRLMEKSS
jgi:multimeric flavodoxin WrbA